MAMYGVTDRAEDVGALVEWVGSLGVWEGSPSLPAPFAGSYPGQAAECTDKAGGIRVPHPGDDFLHRHPIRQEGPGQLDAATAEELHQRNAEDCGEAGAGGGDGQADGIRDRFEREIAVATMK